MDLAPMTDEELHLLKAEIQDELARRENLVSIPSAITVLSTDYAAAGGIPSDLCATCLGNPSP